MPTILLHFLPYIAIGVMALGGWGLWEQHKVDQVKIASANAQVIQDQKDRAESEKQIGILQTKLEDIDARAAPVIQRIVASAPTSGCGPSVGYAIDGVRSMFANPDAGPQPPRSKSDIKGAVYKTIAAFRAKPD